ASGKAFFVIDLETGNKLWEYYNDGTTLDDRQYMNFSLPANPAAVDVNNGGFIDRVYIGDVGGQMWKFDVSATATASWTGKRLFAAPLASGTTNPPGAGEYYPAQGIYGAPTLALDKDLKLWLFFGTGDRNHPNSTTAPNRFYGIKDTTNMTNGATLTETDLADVTGANATAASGWFFRLGPGEKVLAAGNVFNMIAYFSTFTPTSTATCETGFGTAKLYGVQAQTGYAAVDFTTGVALVSTDATKTRSKTIGGGIASMPVIVITPPATATSKPLSSVVVQANLAFAYERQGRTDEAIAAYRKVLELEPGNVLARNNLGALLGRSGRYEEAVRELETLLQRDPANATARGNLETAKRNVALTQERHDRIASAVTGAEARPTDSGAAYNAARVYALHGDHDNALAWLAKALELGYDQTDFLSVDPSLASLRKDPRFAKFLEERGVRAMPPLSR